MFVNYIFIDYVWSHFQLPIASVIRKLGVIKNYHRTLDWDITVPTFTRLLITANNLSSPALDRDNNNMSSATVGTSDSLLFNLPKF